MSTYDSMEVLPIGTLADSIVGLEVVIVGYWVDPRPSASPELKYVVQPTRDVFTKPLDNRYDFPEVPSFAVDVFTCDPSWLVER